MSVQASTIVTGTTPLWYAARATGVISLVLLSTVVVLGIAQQTRAASERWPRLVVSGIHRNLSLLVCVFLALHIVTAEADTFAPVGWWAVVIPFASAYRPLWLGFGTVAFDLFLALIVTSLLRTRISQRLWRAVHWAAYLCWPTAVVHGLGTGTDPRSPAILLLTLACIAAVLAAAAWRLAANWHVHTAIRATAGAAGLASVITVAFWALSGPLAPGWSAKADTPTRHSSTVSVSSAATGITLPVSAAITGTVGSSESEQDQQTVTLSGTGGSDRFTIAISGPPLAGGGVQMTGSRVTFGTAASPNLYTGAVTALDGDTIQARVTDASGATATLTVVATISGNQLSGSLQATAGG
ncbi:ferric reductase-like transmembrane domain-containing protein [Actinospica sp. MGRD01-02]|uniref:Ferric reductase-like transmembrane domain-containing protein n=1 Tax=Actinospica acidithermotolerans TaxID=2828514 RepID=A0A941IHZ4_9ACTN|nr:ferric reductase-like transmembrane domain-containing protein [Actinospica acidithermotolerans]MBR7825658.1 ferric reductase-like transmembrane domain-containing protein [Actinospica acidithermotolerans]